MNPDIQRLCDDTPGCRERIHLIKASMSPRANAVIDFDPKGVLWALRLSPHDYNTGEELKIVSAFRRNF